MNTASELNCNYESICCTYHCIIVTNWNQLNDDVQLVERCCEGMIQFVDQCHLPQSHINQRLCTLHVVFEPLRRFGNASKSVVVSVANVVARSEEHTSEL